MADDRAATRRDNLRRLLADEPVDGVLVHSEPNVTYLTGFTGDSTVLILTRDRAVAVSDGRYVEQLERECPGLEVHIRPVTQLLAPAVSQVIARLGLRTVGFDPNHLTVADFETLRDATGTIALRPLPPHVEDLRAVKDADEIAAIRRAIDSAEAAFDALVSSLRADETEKDVADRLESLMRSHGAQAASFPSIVGVGPNASLPHYRPGPTSRIADSPFVLIDWGASRDGYKSDLTRMVATGTVSDKFETVYRSVLEAQTRAIAAMRPGVRTGDVDAAARGALEEAGLNAYFTHGLGHGIGLEIHEAPRMRKDADTVLLPGMIVTVEPGVYLPGWGGVRIEDDVLITPNGPEILTRVPKALETIHRPVCG
jgi:Xaa-Pro aminopeptidase